MSRVSGVVLCTSVIEETNEHKPWEAINRWLVERNRNPLTLVQERAIGYSPQMCIGIAGFNHFEIYTDEFVATVLGQDWDEPDDVVLTIQPEEAEALVCRPGDAERAAQIEQDHRDYRRRTVILTNAYEALRCVTSDLPDEAHRLRVLVETIETELGLR